MVLGGVSKRFPTLNFAFLEGGVAWAAELYAGLVGHCGKRHPEVIGTLDPNNIDLEYLADLFAEYGQGLVSARPDPGSDFARWPGGWHWADDKIIASELENIGIRSADDLRPLFENRLYFGCEATTRWSRARSTPARIRSGPLSRPSSAPTWGTGT